MVFTDLDLHFKKLQNIQNAFSLEFSTFRVVYSKCKARLPPNKFVDAVKKVRKQLKIICSLDFSSGFVCKNDWSSSNTLELPEWEQVLQNCIWWGRVAISTSNACLLAFAHCEQNVKLGHFLMFYVSLLAILARLHTLSKALCVTVGELALSAKMEMEKIASTENLTAEIVGNHKRKLLEEMGFPNDYDGVLRYDFQDRASQAVTQEDLGEPISRLPAILPNIPQTNLEVKLKAANSVRSLRLACKAEGTDLNEEVKTQVDQVLQETDNICKSLLEAKRLVIQQSALFLTQLMTKSEGCSTGMKLEFPRVAEGKVSREKDDKLSSHMKKLLNSLPCKAKIRKVCLSTLPKIGVKKKKELVKVLRKVKPKLWALKRGGHLEDYKKQVNVLLTKVKKALYEDARAPGQDSPQYFESDVDTPLLDETQEDDEDLNQSEDQSNKAAFEKLLKSCKTVDGLLGTWNDILTNRRDDLTSLLPPKVKKSKLMCVKKNILKYKTLPQKKNFKTTVRKITQYLYK